MTLNTPIKFSVSGTFSPSSTRRGKDPCEHKETNCPYNWGTWLLLHRRQASHGSLALGLLPVSDVSVFKLCLIQEGVHFFPIAINLVTMNLTHIHCYN